MSTTEMLTPPTVNPDSKGRRPAPQARLVIITPNMAQQWLRLNTHNRNLRDYNVSILSGVLQRQEWIPNGETVKFDWNGVLIDGQHRLKAIIRSGIPAETFVVTGLDPRAQETIDVGSSRKIGDALKLRGFSYHTNVGSAARYIWGMRQTGTLRLPAQIPTITQLVEVAEEFPQLQEHGRIVSQVYSTTRAPFGMSMALYELFSQAEANLDAWQSGELGDEPENLNDEYWRRLSKGTGFTSDNDPILKLREQFLRLRNLPQGQQKPRNWILGALMIKAWNAWVDGNEVGALRFRTSGNRPETFPAIRGLEGSEWYRSPIQSLIEGDFADDDEDDE